MDGSHFDTLARSIAQSGTRRRLVSLLLALPLGGVLAIAGEDGAGRSRAPASIGCSGAPSSGTASSATSAVGTTITGGGSGGGNGGWWGRK